MTLAKRRTREFANDVTGMLTGLRATAEKLSCHQDATISLEARRILDTSLRISEMCKAEIKSDAPPHRHRGDCLAHLLSDIDAIIAPDRSETDQPYALRLQVDDEIEFDCDSPILFRILYNLVANAASAVEGLDEARIDVFVSQYRKHLFLQVADNGPGLPAHARDWFVSSPLAQLIKKGHVGHGLANIDALVSGENGEFRLLYTGPAGTRLGISIPAKVWSPRDDDFETSMFAAMTADTMWSHSSLPDSQEETR